MKKKNKHLGMDQDELAAYFGIEEENKELNKEIDIKNNMENKKQELHIDVKGLCATGKSRVMYLIYRTLKAEGFEVNIKSRDYQSVEDFENQIKNNIDEALQGIVSKSTVTISEVPVRLDIGKINGTEMVDEYIPQSFVKDLKPLPLKNKKNECTECGSVNISVEKHHKRTTGPHVPGKLMSYGYYYMENTCNDCGTIWERYKS